LFYFGAVCTCSDAGFTLVLCAPVLVPLYLGAMCRTATHLQRKTMTQTKYTSEAQRMLQQNDHGLVFLK
jgi:hypothetical protein